MRDLRPAVCRSPYGLTEAAATIFVNGRESPAMVVTPTDVRTWSGFLAAEGHANAIGAALPPAILRRDWY